MKLAGGQTVPGRTHRKDPRSRTRPERAHQIPENFLPGVHALRRSAENFFRRRSRWVRPRTVCPPATFISASGAATARRKQPALPSRPQEETSKGKGEAAGHSTKPSRGFGAAGGFVQPLIALFVSRLRIILLPIQSLCLIPRRSPNIPPPSGRDDVFRDFIVAISPTSAFTRVPTE